VVLMPCAGWSAGRGRALAPARMFASPCDDPPVHYYLTNANPSRGLNFCRVRNAG